jgi:hypothetical protein
MCNGYQVFVFRLSTKIICSRLIDVEGIRVGAIDSRVLPKTSFPTRSDLCHWTFEKAFGEDI